MPARSLELVHDLLHYISPDTAQEEMRQHGLDFPAHNTVQQAAYGKWAANKSTHACVLGVEIAQLRVRAQRILAVDKISSGVAVKHTLCIATKRHP